MCNNKVLLMRNIIVFSGSAIFINFSLRLLVGSPLSTNLYGPFTALFLNLVTQVFWACGLLAYLGASRRATVFYFYLCNLAFSLVLLAGALPEDDTIARLVLRAGLLAAPPLLWYTLQLKTAEAGRLPGRVARLALRGWGLAASLVFLLLVGMAAGSFQVNFLTGLPIANFILGSFFVLCWLIFVQCTARTALLRIQTFTMLLGLAVPGVPMSLLSFFPYLLYHEQFISIEHLLPLGLITPLAFFYSINRQRLVPVELRLGRAVFVGLYFGVVLLVGLEVVLCLTRLGRSMILNEENLMIAVSLLLATLAFSPLRRRIQRLADQFIYGSDYDYRVVLQQLTSSLSRLTVTEEMGLTLCNRLSEVLKVSGASLLVGQTADQLKAVAGVGELAEIEPACLKQAGEFMESETRNGFLPGGQILYQIISYNDHTNGLLLLGAKRSEDRFSTTDLSLLTILANSIGAAIDNSHLLDVVYSQVKQLEAAHQEASILNYQLAQVRDQEREDLAYLLHDGVLQNLIFIARHSSFCVNLLEQECSPESRTIKQLQHLSAVAQSSIQEVRNICSGLYPIAVDTVGLGAALRWLSEETQRLHPVKVFTQLEGLDLAERMPHLIEHSLFVMARETVSNTLKHAQAQQIWLSLCYKNHQVVLEVKDDGCGMAAVPNLGQLAWDGHLGLAGLRVRAERLGGQLAIESEPGRGTTIRLILPGQKLDHKPATAQPPLVLVNAPNALATASSAF